MKRKHLLWLTGAAMSMLSAGAAVAGDWVDIKNPKELRAIYSDKTFKGKGGDGVPFIGHYRADGTGVIIRAGQRVARTWKVKGKDQVCVTDQSGTNCFRLRRHSRDRAEIVGQHVTQNWIFQARVEDGVPQF